MAIAWDREVSGTLRIPEGGLDRCFTHRKRKLDVELGFTLRLVGFCEYLGAPII